MSPEKPLHMQVAEALGCRVQAGDCGCMVSEPYIPGVQGPHDRWLHGSEWSGHYGDIVRSPLIPRYDTDWAVTGPLIEKYGFWLRQLDQTLSGPQPWDAFRNDDLTFPRGFGPTPLLAVCNLIVRLAEAGILKAAEGR